MAISATRAAGQLAPPRSAPPNIVILAGDLSDSDGFAPGHDSPALP